jgi:hypothetical protein
MECEPLFAEGDGMPDLANYSPHRHLSTSPRERSPSPQVILTMCNKYCSHLTKLFLQASTDSFMFSASARDGSDFLHFLGSPMGTSDGPGGPVVSEEDSRDNPYLGATTWTNVDHLDHPNSQEVGRIVVKLACACT